MRERKVKIYERTDGHNFLTEKHFSEADLTSRLLEMVETSETRV